VSQAGGIFDVAESSFRTEPRIMMRLVDPMANYGYYSCEDFWRMFLFGGVN